MLRQSPVLAPSTDAKARFAWTIPRFREEFEALPQTTIKMDIHENGEVSPYLVGDVPVMNAQRSSSSSRSRQSAGGPKCRASGGSTLVWTTKFSRKAGFVSRSQRHRFARSRCEAVLPRTSASDLKSHRLTKTRKQRKRPDFGSVILLLQGGGALGAYQARVYEALSEADLHPDWVAGISIGSINAAIIAGNPPRRPSSASSMLTGSTPSTQTFVSASARGTYAAAT